VSTEKKTLWELLWDYDPNGLLVVDTDLKITLVNSALCAMFKTSAEAIVGQPVSVIIDDADEFLTVWRENQPVKARDKHYPACHLYVRKVMFPIRDEGIIACIMVDVTHDRQQRDEMRKLKRETVQRVGEVINNQMRVAHQIASLLGETTAESKVSLLQLVEVLEEEGV